MLDFRPGNPEARLYVGEPVAIGTGTGAAYLFLGPDRVEMAGVQSLMGLLDARATGMGLFRSWYESAYSRGRSPVAAPVP